VKLTFLPLPVGRCDLLELPLLPWARRPRASHELARRTTERRVRIITAVVVSFICPLGARGDERSACMARKQEQLLWARSSRSRYTKGDMREEIILIEEPVCVRIGLVWGGGEGPRKCELPLLGTYSSAFPQKWVLCAVCVGETRRFY
jgi:hypothetical protein